MRWPLDNVNITNGYSATHTANDLGAPQGTPIKAPDSGKITGLNNIASAYFGGKYIVLQGKSGYRYYMGHLSTVDVKLGQAVNEGQVIGKVGQTGFGIPSKGILAPSGPHVHLEMSKGGQTYNPSKVIKKSKPPKKEEQVRKATRWEVRNAYRAILGREATPDEEKKRTGKPYEDVVHELITYVLKNKTTYQIYKAKVATSSKASPSEFIEYKPPVLYVKK